MASIVIVTKQCYLICEAINYIAVNEIRDSDAENALKNYGVNKRKVKKKTMNLRERVKYHKTEQLHKITIDFIAAPTHSGPNAPRNGGTGSETSSVDITVRGNDRCMALYNSMVNQIREQMPDQVYLDNLIDKFLIDNKVEDA